MRLSAMQSSRTWVPQIRVFGPEQSSFPAQPSCSQVPPRSTTTAVRDGRSPRGRPDSSTATTTICIRSKLSLPRATKVWACSAPKAAPFSCSSPAACSWDYTSPAGKLFLLDGKYAWFYSRLRTGTAYPRQTARRSSLPVALSARTYPDRKGTRPLKLTPGPARPIRAHRPAQRPGKARPPAHPHRNRAKAEPFNAIEIEEDGWRAHPLHLHRRAAQRLALPESSFHFTPPAGVPVVDAMPPAKRAVVSSKSSVASLTSTAKRVTDYCSFHWRCFTRTAAPRSGPDSPRGWPESCR